MTPNITNSNCVELSSSSNNAGNASAISPSTRPEREMARNTQKGGKRRESFLSVLLRALSTVAF